MAISRTILTATVAAAAFIASATLSTPQAHAQKKGKVLRLDALTVEGKIQKPQAFYLLQRSILNFAELERTESFLPKIVQSVEKPGF